MPATDQSLLRVRDLEVEFRTRRRATRAVSGVSFDIAAGETLGVVGESGSGKTTIGRAILGLTPVTSGSIHLGSRDITHAGRRERRALASEIQAVFQDPYSSLNPARTVGASLREAAPGQSRAAADRRAAELLHRVGLSPAALAKYPAQFSGGQRQRLAAARALMAAPRLVICDEPVSALDVSVQAQVLNLLRELQSELSLSYLFVGHNLDVVRFMSDRILVLYRGHVLEEGLATTVARTPRSPYTRTLVASTHPAGASAGAATAAPVQSSGPAASQDSSDSGCPFAHRCPFVVDICRQKMPVLQEMANGERVACHRHPLPGPTFPAGQ